MGKIEDTSMSSLMFSLTPTNRLIFSLTPTSIQSEAGLLRLCHRLAGLPKLINFRVPGGQATWPTQTEHLPQLTAHVLMRDAEQEAQHCWAFL